MLEGDGLPYWSSQMLSTSTILVRDLPMAAMPPTVAK
jgi:hypothetical protein